MNEERLELIEMESGNDACKKEGHTWADRVSTDTAVRYVQFCVRWLINNTN